MFNKELSRLSRTSTDKAIEHITTEPLTLEKVVEMLSLSGDIAQSLPMETAHKLWDCYVDMIGEVKERLSNLYVNLVLEFQGLHCTRYKKSDCLDLATSFTADNFVQIYGISTIDRNRHFSVN